MASLDPSCWGPATWFALHSFAMGYPESDPSDEVKNHYKQFYESLEFVLPCIWCRVNFKNNIQQMPIDDYLDSRQRLALWVYQLHNMVNDETGVPESKRPSFEEVYNKYDGYRGDCDNNTLTCGSDHGDKKCNMRIVNTLGSGPSLVYNIILLVLIAGLIIITFIIGTRKK